MKIILGVVIGVCVVGGLVMGQGRDSRDILVYMREPLKPVFRFGAKVRSTSVQLPGVDHMQHIKFQELYRSKSTGVHVLQSQVSRVYRCHIAASKNIKTVMDTLRNHPDVFYVQPNYTYQLVTLNSSLTKHASPLSMLDFPIIESWISKQSSTLIAVIDTGVDSEHPALKNRLWKNTADTPNNGRDDDHNGYIDDVLGWNTVDQTHDVTDTLGHGTHVTGIIAADPEYAAGITGIGKGCQVLPIKAANDRGIFTSLSVALAIDYALMMGADIINLSLGSPKQHVPEERLLRDAVAAAVNEGVWVVAAAGNQGIDIDEHQYVPAIYDDVIAVAALTYDKQIAGYSNYGDSVDVAAPGGSFKAGIVSTLPHSKSGNGVGVMRGTSMAAPFISGILGMLSHSFPATPKSKIKQALMQSATDLIAHTAQGKRFKKRGVGIPSLPKLIKQLDQQDPELIHSWQPYMPYADEIVVTVAVQDDFKSPLFPKVRYRYRWIFSDDKQMQIDEWKDVIPTKKQGTYVSQLEPVKEAIGLEYNVCVWDTQSKARCFPDQQSWQVAFFDEEPPVIKVADQAQQLMVKKGWVEFSLKDSSKINWDALIIEIKQEGMISKHELYQGSPEINIDRETNKIRCNIKALGLNLQRSMTMYISVEDEHGNYDTIVHLLQTSAALQLLQRDTHKPGIRVGPNPIINNTCSIEYELTQSAHIDIQVTSIHGQLMWRQVYTKNNTQASTPGPHRIQWPLTPDIPNGPYIVSVTARNDTAVVLEHQKVLVLR